MARRMQANMMPGGSRRSSLMAKLDALEGSSSPGISGDMSKIMGMSKRMKRLVSLMKKRGMTAPTGP